MVSIVADIGPDPIINLSPLDELASQKLSIVGMTVISMGLGTGDVRNKRYYKLHGPIPVPDFNELEAICVPFNVRPDLGTDDDRIENHGRECTLWLLFHSTFRTEIFSVITKLEEITRTILLPFKNESELRNKVVFQTLLDNIQQVKINHRQLQDKKIIIPSHYTKENSSFGFYSISKSGELVPLNNFQEISHLNSLIMVDIENKMLNVLKLNPKTSKHELFLAGRAASNLNIQRLKRDFIVKNVTDELEIKMLLHKVNLIHKELSHS